MVVFAFDTHTLDLTDEYLVQNPFDGLNALMVCSMKITQAMLMWFFGENWKFKLIFLTSLIV